MFTEQRIQRKSSNQVGSDNKTGTQYFFSFQTIVLNVIVFSSYALFTLKLFFFFNGWRSSRNLIWDQENSFCVTFPFNRKLNTFPRNPQHSSPYWTELSHRDLFKLEESGKASVYRPCGEAGKREGSWQIDIACLSFSFDCIWIGLTKQIKQNNEIECNWGREEYLKITWNGSLKEMNLGRDLNDEMITTLSVLVGKGSMDMSAR